MSHARKPGGSGSSTAAKRIKKEIADLSKENLGAITLTPNESNIFLWRAQLPGPTGSPYEGGLFDVDVRIPEDYPFAPPHLQFLTKVYHCNIASTGAICLDLLKTAWSPALSLYKVILSLSSLLTDPNPADPLVPAIATEYKRNKAKHDATAKEWVKLYALPKKPVAAPPVAPPINRTDSSTSSASRKAIARPGTSSVTPQPAQIAGTRRANPYANGDASGSTSSKPIELSDSDDEGGKGAGANGENGGSGNKGDGRGERATKRMRTAGNGSSAPGSHGGTGMGTSSDDVIVIDE